MRYLLISLTVLLAGCNQQSQEWLDSLAGFKTERVLLVKDPITIGPEGIVLKSASPLRVVGEEAHVCLSLKGGIPLGPRPTMEKAYNEALGGADVSGTLTLENGQHFPVRGSGPAWSKYGRITAGDEIAVCLSCGCGAKPAVGSVVSEVAVSSTKPLRVLGIYWESTNSFDTPKKEGQ